MKLDECAPAKINLTLKVLGRRADGFHEIESLVAFAGLSDALSLKTGAELSLETVGPFAGALSGGSGNLVLEAARRVKERCPGVRVGAFVLEKNLPVAAGLGGGSADAGAALRLIGRANPGVIPPRLLEDLAGQLGSDVPACLMSHACMMRGRGEKLSHIETFPALDIVLVNPAVELSAGDVYGALDAPELGDAAAECAPAQRSFSSADDVLSYMSDAGNDLAQPAIRLAPVIGDVLAGLSKLDGCRTARMSGSGSTCFAVFANAGLAAGARERLRSAHPDWWVVSTRLG